MDHGDDQAKDSRPLDLQLAYLHSGENIIVLLSGVTYIVSIPYK